MDVKKTYETLFPGADLPRIEKYVEQYPYYAPLHFFHLAMKSDTPESQPKLTGKLDVFFNNPFLLKNRLLEMTGEKNISAPMISMPTVDHAGTTKEELLFEPLHTTDYFASQGIKLSQEVQEGDKFGKQLKSFTDWLKTMKKLPQSQVAEQIPLDSQVAKMAEKSNEDEDVLTESMADVLVEQGKNARAIEIYRKLSLLNPAKSAYFAVKIDRLKGK